MTHKSRLGGIIIDCQVDDLDAAGDFWSKALGIMPRQSDNPVDNGYVVLNTRPEDIHVEIQKVNHPSRVHIDIETDDVEAEAERLERLGATRVEKVNDWWVMQAPTGQRFCVIPAQRADFASDANVWE